MAGYKTFENNSIEQTAYTEERLIEMVKLRMDEIDQNVKTVIDVGISDNKPLTDIINGLLNECRIDVLNTASVNMLPKALYSAIYSSKTNDERAVVDNNHVLPNGEHLPTISNTGVENYYFVHLVLPEDALRIVSVKCGKWLRIVNSVFDTNTKEYKRQFYEFTRSKAKNPVVIHIDGTTYGLFPCEIKSVHNQGEGEATYTHFESDTVNLVYISNLTRYEDFDEQAINAICWGAATKAFTAMGMNDAATRAQQIYISLLGTQQQK